MFPEFQMKKCRDPYPTIAEKAVGRLGRHIATTFIVGNQYGGGVGFIVISAKFMDNIFHYIFPDDTFMSTCKWMPVIFLIVAPLCWFGTPIEFWWLAPTALLTTACACVTILVKMTIDVGDPSSCYGIGTTNSSIKVNYLDFKPEFPSPESFLGFGEAFSLLMFAFAGCTCFPTYQADMNDRRLFPRAVLIAFALLFFLYVPMAAAGYFELGEAAR